MNNRRGFSTARDCANSRRLAPKASAYLEEVEVDGALGESHSRVEEEGDGRPAGTLCRSGRASGSNTGRGSGAEEPGARRLINA